MTGDKPTDKTQDQKIKESITIRGICSAIQAMSFPTFENLNEMLKRYGLKLVSIK